MSRETPETPDPGSETSAAYPQAVGGEAMLTERLLTVERAYAELLQRVRWYEREREELKGRLEKLLSHIGRGAALFTP